MIADMINGSLEFGGAFAIFLHVKQLYKDKAVAGVNVKATAFFMFWGFWNLFYYPSLEQWWSLTGGLAIVILNTFWLGQMLYYTRKNK